jgi:hypothetical protein
LKEDIDGVAGLEMLEKNSHRYARTAEHGRPTENILVDDDSLLFHGVLHTLAELCEKSSPKVAFLNVERSASSDGGSDGARAKSSGLALCLPLGIDMPSLPQHVIYYFHSGAMPLYLLTMFAKNARANLSKAERNDLATLVKVLVGIWLER